MQVRVVQAEQAEQVEQAGTGGNGGTGGPMRAGSNCFGPNGIEAGEGGNGGKGGNGGNGANGENGVAGMSAGYHNQAGIAPIVSGNSVPNPTGITLGMNRGCSNSEITLSKTGGGDWDLLGGGLFVPNLSAGESGYNPSSSNIVIYYPQIRKCSGIKRY